NSVSSRRIELLLGESPSFLEEGFQFFPVLYLARPLGSVISRLLIGPRSIVDESHCSADCADHENQPHNDFRSEHQHGLTVLFMKGWEISRYPPTPVGGCGRTTLSNRLRQTTLKLIT